MLLCESVQVVESDILNHNHQGEIVTFKLAGFLDKAVGASSGTEIPTEWLLRLNEIYLRFIPNSPFDINLE